MSPASREATALLVLSAIITGVHGVPLLNNDVEGILVAVKNFRSVLVNINKLFNLLTEFSGSFAIFFRNCCTYEPVNLPSGFTCQAFTNCSQLSACQPWNSSPQRARNREFYLNCSEIREVRTLIRDVSHYSELNQNVKLSNSRQSERIKSEMLSGLHVNFPDAIRGLARAAKCELEDETDVAKLLENGIGLTNTAEERRQMLLAMLCNVNKSIWQLRNDLAGL